tara:strand:- start:10196 stop:10966 length:771 start_codon:yes stop_codon:yes gene_type:complete
MINRKLIKNNYSRPLVSIITVVKNGQKYLDETIKSVISQSYENIEYIIIDGNSTDNTQKIANKYKNYITLYKRQADKNLWEAMNSGIKLAQGSILGIINADDVYDKKAVYYAVKYLKKRNLDIIFGTVHKHVLKHGFNPQKAYYSFGFYTTMSVGTFFKKKIFKEIGLFDSRFLSADLDLLLKLIFSKKYKGMSSKKNEYFGYFRPGGFSSKIKYRDHQADLNKIRINNKQSKLFVYSIYLYKIIKNFKKFLFNKH